MKLLRSPFSAEITMSLPLLKPYESSAGFPLDLGSIGLECEGRKFRMDTGSTNWDIENEKLNVCCILNVVLDVFPENEEYPYDLLISDLSNPKITAEAYVSQDTDQDEDLLDFKEFTAKIILTIDGKEIQIPCTLE